MRIKSALTHRGRSANLKSATWKVGKKQYSYSFIPKIHNIVYQQRVSNDIPCGFDRFSTVRAEQRVALLLGYSPEELLGRSIYDLCHTLDTNCLTKNHLNLCFKSQSVSGQYRMLVKGGGYVWVESHSAVIPSVRPSKSRPGGHQPLCILCVTYVLSGVEEPTLQLSLEQTGHRYMR
ncbi:Endothelial PAS domain-containing protein 1 [Collichthys lucidus]|uniref:Endothelial PAS domain-containing protein 1 n=1 Tax=Collichthys lucidus TaxID=240159 RepID=A0A4U5VMV9_COLLU|nr:Endothelial PAS domain-containing protein 1 [Collichthys lucidus]